MCLSSKNTIKTGRAMMNLDDIIKATARKFREENEANGTTPEQRLESLADMITNLMNLKLEQLLKKGLSPREAAELLRKIISEGDEPFR